MGNPNMKSCQRQKEDHSQTENLLKEVENSSLVWENSLGQGFQWYFWQKFVQGIFNTAFKPFATFDAGKWIFSFVNPCVYFKAICGCMPYHIWMHEMYHIEKSICLLEMWRDIRSQIALKCIQGFIKERSFLTAWSVTRHFKAFKACVASATFDAGKWLFSFVNLLCVV